MQAKLSVGDQELTATLPVTVTHDRDRRWFRTEIAGHLQIEAGDDQRLTFEVTEPVSTDRMPSYLADDKPGTEHDGFMIKSITLKSLAPLAY